MAAALAAALAGACASAAADGNPPSSQVETGPVTALVRTARQSPDDRGDQRKKAEAQDESKDNWPTDDFGRPLRECDVPWDFVPSK
ncbi:MAG TPA: hypothetical protein VF801_12670 [Rhodocyclaceae bacterium]